MIFSCTIDRASVIENVLMYTIEFKNEQCFCIKKNIFFCFKPGLIFLYLFTTYLIALLYFHLKNCKCLKDKTDAKLNKHFNFLIYTLKYTLLLWQIKSLLFSYSLSVDSYINYTSAPSTHTFIMNIWAMRLKEAACIAIHLQCSTGCV